MTKHALESPISATAVSSVMAATAVSAAASRRRTRLVASAVGTSLFSKVATATLQFGAIPLAARTLGTEQFGAFVAVSAAAGWMSMGAVGLGPGVTRGVAEAMATNDIPRVRQYIATGTAAIVAMACIFALAALALIYTGAVAAVFGPTFAVARLEMERAFVVIAFASLAMVTFGLADSAQAGVVEHYIGNIWSALGNWCAAGAVAVTALFSPTIAILALAVTGPAVIARGVNAVAFFRRHRDLVPAKDDVQLRLLPTLLSTGVAFLLIQVGGYISMDLTIVVSAARVGPSDTAALGVLLQVAMMLGGLAAMVTQPLWPAIAQAQASGDKAWTKRAYSAVLMGTIPLGLLGGAALFVFAGPLGSIVYGGRVTIPSNLALAVGVFFPLSVWAHLHSFVVVGLGSPIVAGAMQLLESTVAIALTLILVPLVGVVGVGIALGAAVAVTSAWSLPIICLAKLGWLSRTPT